MVQVETFGACVLILGDCLSPEVACFLGGIDGWVGDPPYAFNNSGGGKFRKARKASNGIVRHGLDKGFDLAALDLGAPRSLTVFCHNDQLVTMLPELAKRFDRHAVLTWRKTNASPFANKHYRADTEFYVHAWNMADHPVGGPQDKSRVWDGGRGGLDGGQGFDHPTVKPLKLMRRIVRNMSAARILDPFMGTGTTGEACLIEGRGFVGIEKDPTFFDMACRRLDRAMQAAAA
jgi:site-specific DNA-methyltransferase (adenine-specific)